MDDSESPQRDGPPEIKVKDRRRFTAEGDPVEMSSSEEVSREDLKDEEKKLSKELPSVAEMADSGESSGGQTRPDGSTNAQFNDPVNLPPASFEMLIFSLGMQAQMELGKGTVETEDPPNLEIARHTIDLLSVLQEKTRGNLSLEEQRLLENTLTELRFRYVQAVGEINKAPDNPSS